MITLGALKSIIADIEELGIPDDAPIIVASSPDSDVADLLGTWAEVFYDAKECRVFRLSSQDELSAAKEAGAIQAIALWPEWNDPEWDDEEWEDETDG